MGAMAAVDAQMLLLSAKVPNDQFLLYAFDGTPRDVGLALAEVRANAERFGELHQRVAGDHPWRFPRWESGPLSAGQFTMHAADSWQSCLDSVGRLAGDQLDPARMCWRVHAFPSVPDVPPGSRPGSVVVVQIAHALGDGTRSAALAAALLGRRRGLPQTGPPDRGFLPWRALVAARAHRSLIADTASGALAPPGQPRPVLSINARSGAAPVLRTVVVDRGALPGPTVTVGALLVISEALAGYLSERGEDVSRLAAEVAMSDRAVIPKAHNNFRTVGVGLFPELSRPARAQGIVRELAAHRARGEHPATAASAAAFAAVPAWLLRWGMSRFDPEAHSATVTGHTVVSSVDRGPADLSFGGSPVVLTAGYPALSSMMSLTHGVHGIGDTVALSLHADPATIDVDAYLGQLTRALGRPA